MKRERPGMEPLPTDRDAEELAVGAALLEPHAFGRLTRHASSEDFTMPVFRAAWKVMERRYTTGEPIDVELVLKDVDTMGVTGPTESSAGMLTGALARVPWAAHGPSYAKRVHEAALRRSIITSSTEATKWAYDPGGDVTGMVAAVTSLFQQYDDALAGEETGDVADALSSIEVGVGQRGFETGVPPYDRWSPGLRPGEVHTIGGYSGVGKTWVMCQMVNSALEQGAKVAVFSLEMPAVSLIRRLMANRAGACALRWGNPGATFNQHELDRILEAKDFLLNSGLRVYHEQRSLPQIAAVVRSSELDVWALDYLQLMDSIEGASEYEALTSNCKGIQRLAQKSNSCGILLSQVNEAHQHAAGSSRTLGLKGSGAIGSISDFVLTVQATDQPGILELAAGKNRHGDDRYSGAIAKVRMDKETGRITNMIAYPPSTARGFKDD